MSAAGRRRVERLFWRAGFGALPGEVAALARRDLSSLVSGLLAPLGPELRRAPAPRANGRPIDPVNVAGHDILWWLDRMIRGRHALVERMTLNWHDHFATSNEKVTDARLMLAQYRTLRRHALGTFRGLAHAVLTDPAMQRFLDLANSDRTHPNENFAREFFELFTLGVNNGYTETDVREAARALTGFTSNGAVFGYNPARHDDGVKVIFGRSGRFGPADVVDLAIDNPRHAPFICGKIWRYFTARPCPPATLRRMVSAYRRSGTGLRPVLRIVLTHPALYAGLSEPDQVKPPVVYLAGMLRKAGLPVNFEDWWSLLTDMGQAPFYPPNVNGWDQDEAWLSTSTIRARYQAASQVIRLMRIREGSVPQTQSPAEAIASAMAATGRPWLSAQSRSSVARFARTSVATRDAHWQPEHYWPERQRILRHFLLAGPDAQVC